MKRIISMLLITALLLTLAACGGSAADTKAAHVLDNQDPLVPMDQLSPVKNSQKLGYQLEEPAKGEEIAVMTMKTGEVIKIRFFPDEAPKAVYNFKLHAIQGYYDGLTFHRVMENFMIQGGSPDGTGTDGVSVWDQDFEDEFASNLVNIDGSLSMANRGPTTNGSQFFIVQCGTPMTENDAMAYQFQWTVNKLQREIDLAPADQAQAVLEQAQGKLNGYQQNGLSQELLDEYQPAVQRYKEVGGTPHLDYKHTVFGQVTEGMEVVDAIAAVATDPQDNKPLEDVSIITIQVND